MTYIVNDNCINCKYTDCVEVCPVDCFYEGENMLVIHPDECIDCGVCEPECPPEAILLTRSRQPRNGSRSIARWPKSGRTSCSGPTRCRTRKPPRKRPASSINISSAIRARATDATFRLIRQQDRFSVRCLRSPLIDFRVNFGYITNTLQYQSASS